ncbi:hypothetical protein [Halomonas sp. H5]|uniref:hypothetical protein n=1 Tax=Halomonas sp. H5 TaxID=3423910 RepID=UPI003D36425A
MNQSMLRRLEWLERQKPAKSNRKEVPVSEVHAWLKERGFDEPAPREGDTAMGWIRSLSKAAIREFLNHHPVGRERHA